MRVRQRARVVVLLGLAGVSLLVLVFRGGDFRGAFVQPLGRGPSEGRSRRTDLPQAPVYLEIAGPSCAEVTEFLEFRITAKPRGGIERGSLDTEGGLFIIAQKGIELVSITPTRPAANDQSDAAASFLANVPDVVRSGENLVITTGPLGDLVTTTWTVVLQKTDGAEFGKITGVLSWGGTTTWTDFDPCRLNPIPFSPTTLDTQPPEEVGVLSHDSADKLIGRSSATSLAGTLNITLTVRYLDNNNASRQLPYAIVEVWDADTFSADDLVASSWTNSEGVATFAGISNSGDESGTLDIYYKVKLISASVDVTDGNSTWDWVSTTTANVADGNLSQTLTLQTDTGACHIFKAVNNAWSCATVSASPDPSRVIVIFPSSDNGTYFSPSTKKISIASAQAWFETAPLHEYGHFLDDAYAGGFTGYYPNYPQHWFTDHLDGKTAWGEGWATFFSCYVKSLAPYSNPHMYVISGSSWNVETGADGWSGLNQTDVEGAVAASLLDIYDPANDAGDTLTDTFPHIWGVFDAGVGNETVFNFWDEWGTRGLGHLPEVAEILNEHGCWTKPLRGRSWWCEPPCRIRAIEAGVLSACRCA